MANPLETIKKFKNRSWKEIRTRGEQAFSARSEQIGLSGKLPTDEEFQKLLEKSQFDASENAISAQAVYEKFRESSKFTFFSAFRRKDATLEVFRHFWGEKNAPVIIDKAERILEGRFDLLGFSNLNFGASVDWHFEPISGKRSPLKHWKQFDELGTDETGDKKIVWELNRHQHFFTLGAAFWLTKDERFAAAFAEHLESWMQQNPPANGINWFSSLEIAFRAMSWIWAFNFFKDSQSFTPELFYKALKYLYVHGRHIEKYLSTYYSPNTHLTGEALGLYYIGTQLPFFKRAEHWRKTGEQILLKELDRQLFSDGVYFEQTTWYQRYTADFYTHFLILRTLGNAPENNKQSAEKLENRLQSALDFLMYITRPDGTTPIIGDDDGGRMLPLTGAKPDDFRGTLAVGAVLFERGDYKYVAGTPAEEIIWLLGAEGVDAFEKQKAFLPKTNSAGFEAGGYFVMRDGWANTDNYLLIDCGEVGALSGGHGHADTLAVDLAVHGETLLVDSGTYTYHESNELRDYFRSSAAHNTLTIDGKSSSMPAEKFSWKTKAAPKVSSWIAEERFDFFRGSHDGYSQNSDAPAVHHRSILFIKNDYWIVRDFVETAAEHNYALNFHFDDKANPAIEATGSGILCVGENSSKKREGWRLFTFGDNGDWEKKESPISTVYGAKRNAPFFRFSSRGTGSQEFFTFLLPSEIGYAKPEVYETSVVGGRAFVIKYRDYTDLFVYADSNESILHTEFFSTNFRFLWARMSAGEDLPEEFVMIGGTHFTLDNRDVINHPTELQFAVARRFGSKLNVRTNESILSVTIPQKTPSTYILKTSEQS
ncbi:MAG TPA: alginate lyase family protein [Pyrinomonadaceae bacterium]|jgi:hypothetical protein